MSCSFDVEGIMDRKRLKEYRAIEAAIKSITQDIERTARRIDTAKIHLRRLSQDFFTVS